MHALLVLLAKKSVSQFVCVCVLACACVSFVVPTRLLTVAFELDLAVMNNESLRNRSNPQQNQTHFLYLFCCSNWIPAGGVLGAVW